MKKSILSLMISMAMVCCLVTPTFAFPYSIFPVDQCDTTPANYPPHLIGMDSGYVAWTGVIPPCDIFPGCEREIFLYDPNTGTTTQITDHPGLKEYTPNHVYRMSPSGHVVWWGSAGMWVYDPSTQSYTQMASSSQYADVNSSGQVAYQSGNNIFLYDPNTDTTQQITTDGTYKGFIRISDGGHVAWFSPENGPTDMYFYDPANGVTKICDDCYSGYCGEPFCDIEINAVGQLVWCGYDGVSLYDPAVNQISHLSGPPPECNEQYGRPRINDSGFVVWSGREPSASNNIYLYNPITETTVIIDDTSHQGYTPHINNSGQVVYASHPGPANQYDLFIYDIDTETSIRFDRPEWYDRDPLIFDSGQVAVYSKVFNIYPEPTCSPDIFLLSTNTEGKDVLVNTHTVGDQRQPTVAMDASGNFVIAWEGWKLEEGTHIFAQRYDGTGNTVGGEFQVDTITTTGNSKPIVAMEPDGDFVIFWTGYDPNNSLTHYARRYDSAGNPLAPEFQVDASVAAIDADGNFVVVWDDNDRHIFARMYNSSGSPVAPAFQVNSGLHTRSYSPSVAMDAAGNFVVAWTGDDQRESGIIARMYNSEGTPVDLEFQVNTTYEGYQMLPSVAMNADGAFVIAWRDEHFTNPGQKIFAQMYDSAGNPVGEEIQTPAYSTIISYTVSAAIDATGNFVIAWNREEEPNSSGSANVFAQRYDSDGNPVGSELQVNTYTRNDQRVNTPSNNFVAMDPTGNFVIVWWSQWQDGSQIGVFMKRYLPEGVGDDIVVVPTDTNTGGTPVTITFDHVTIAGETTLTTTADCTSSSGFQLGDPPTCYDIDTFAEYWGDIHICIDYSGISYSNEQNLLLYHEGSNITDSGFPDTASNTICGTVGGFSEFTIQEPVIVCPSDPVAAGTEVNCRYSLSYQPVSATATWTWGDGETDPGVIGGDPLQITGSNTYLDPGVYTVQLSVIEDSTSWSDSYQYVVVYDPFGGFVTGGGWIDSPLGAYVAKPELTGKATFGFVSKYQKGANVPVGNTEFRFRTAGLNFHSDNYEWLVITGNGSAQFKGVGTINGMGEYKFMLWGGDNPDTFRIKIWEEDETTAVETVIYDNGITQEIAGGSIVIHKK